MKKNIILSILIGMLIMTAKSHAHNVYVFLGAPGAGKGTQCQKLSNQLKIPHISTGDLFREQVKKDSPLSVELKNYMEKGLLIPDEVVAEMLMERVENEDCKNGYLLDGFPRTLNQAKVLEKYIAKEDMIIVSIQSDEEAILKRLTGRRSCPNCNSVYHIENLKPKVENKCDKCSTELITRSDDQEDVIKNRLAIFNQEATPINEHYKDGFDLIEISSNYGAEQCFTHLLEGISEINKDLILN